MPVPFPSLFYMGKYITQSDIENVFGTDNVLIWSNLDNSENTVNASRITSAIDYAEEDIENRFRDGRYKVPFVGTSGSIPRVLIDWMSKLAGIWLYECRPGGADEDEEYGFSNMLDRVDKDINAYMSGQRRLSLYLAESDTPSAPVSV